MASGSDTVSVPNHPPVFVPSRPFCPELYSQLSRVIRQKPPSLTRLSRRRQLHPWTYSSKTPLPQVEIVLNFLVGIYQDGRQGRAPGPAETRARPGRTWLAELFPSPRDMRPFI